MRSITILIFLAALAHTAMSAPAATHQQPTDTQYSVLKEQTRAFEMEVDEIRRLWEKDAAHYERVTRDLSLRRRDSSACQLHYALLQYRAECFQNKEITPCSQTCIVAYETVLLQLLSSDCEDEIVNKVSAKQYATKIRLEFVRSMKLQCISEHHEDFVFPNEGRCGDGTCNPFESCETCTADCGACTECGNSICTSPWESCSSCPEDCGVCPTCGDGICNGEEHCDTCPGDCGVCKFCGDGICSGRENCITCYIDCGVCPSCGDGKCDWTIEQGEGFSRYFYFEDEVVCPDDCEVSEDELEAVLFPSGHGSHIGEQIIVNGNVVPMKPHPAKPGDKSQDHVDNNKNSGPHNSAVPPAIADGSEASEVAFHAPMPILSGSAPPEFELPPGTFDANEIMPMGGPEVIVDVDPFGDTGFREEMSPHVENSNEVFVFDDDDKDDDSGSGSGSGAGTGIGSGYKSGRSGSEANERAASRQETSEEESADRRTTQDSEQDSNGDILNGSQFSLRRAYEMHLKLRSKKAEDQTDGEPLSTYRQPSEKSLDELRAEGYPEHVLRQEQTRRNLLARNLPFDHETLHRKYEFLRSKRFAAEAAAAAGAAASVPEDKVQRESSSNSDSSARKRGGRRDEAAVQFDGSAAANFGRPSSKYGLKAQWASMKTSFFEMTSSSNILLVSGSVAACLVAVIAFALYRRVRSSRLSKEQRARTDSSSTSSAAALEEFIESPRMNKDGDIKEKEESKASSPITIEEVESGMLHSPQISPLEKSAQEKKKVAVSNGNDNLTSLNSQLSTSIPPQTLPAESA